MDLVLCHTTADFDTLGAAVGVSCLRPGTRIVLTGGCHPSVQKFLSIRRNHYSLIERRAVTLEQIRSITLVDAHQRDRIGPAADWIDYAIANDIPITIYDHHLDDASDIPADELHIESVGATTTLIAEALQAEQIELTPYEATVMALGIHVDTGSLTYERATPRDAAALAWLMAQGTHQKAIAAAAEPGLSPRLQALLTEALDQIQTQKIEGYELGWVYLKTEQFVPGLSSLTSQLLSLLGLDSVLLGSEYATSKGDRKLTLIGRARSHAAYVEDGVNFQQLFEPLGGGGHPYAAAAVVRVEQPETVFSELVEKLSAQVPHAPTARELMSSPVRTIRPATTIAEAQRILLRYGHSGLCVAETGGRLVGVISRRDIDLALHHGFSHAPVKGYMIGNLKTITPDTPLSEIQALMVTYDVGRLPVLQEVRQEQRLVGIVTRTDVLRQLHQDYQRPAQSPESERSLPQAAWLHQRLEHSLSAYPSAIEGAQLWSILSLMAQEAAARGWHLYLVGGAVRDLLLAAPEKPVQLKDIDLVVDGFQAEATVGAGVALAQVIQDRYPEADLQVHGQFQTAALIWHSSAESAPLMIDIATARTEFYPYPAANPEVEASSIRQDLYRRDFTVNAMAIRLSLPQPGQLLDFFGGWLDLQQRQIRVLHANSFIEDPTRIYRAVRFAVRLDFEIEAQTEQFIRYAVESGIYSELRSRPGRAPALQTRLKTELKYILEAPYWQKSLSLLDKLGALSCLHPSLSVQPELWHQIRRVERWMTRFDAGVAHWQMLLEVLLAYLAPADRLPVAETLQLPEQSLARLQSLADCETHLLVALPQAEKPSEIYQLLAPFDRPLLFLVSARHPRALGRQVWRYLTQLAEVQPPLDGHDLKQLGYRPGPQFKTMLADLRWAALDGELQTPEAAQAYLAQHYPR
ncbi:MAG: CBS domain-containing protein [Leptolyngbya sp. SIO4C1]|nr:CBS domain-containing protein [Leptolyngbya sp. SIO4C1]